MPTETYMVIDPRHDHSMRIPRPDLSVKLGTPNACNKCHTDKKPEWAAQAVQAWYPNPLAGHQKFAEAFAVSASGGTGATEKLMPDTAWVRSEPRGRLTDRLLMARTGRGPGVLMR
jgi:hypothetical protein